MVSQGDMERLSRVMKQVHRVKESYRKLSDPEKGLKTAEKKVMKVMKELKVLKVITSESTDRNYTFITVIGKINTSISSNLHSTADTIETQIR